MRQKKKSGRPNLAAKKELLLHTYDSFLEAQTRLSTLAHYSYRLDSSEIDTKQNLLFLDDLLIFAITARRLIELTQLRSFSNSQYVRQYGIDRRENSVEIAPLKDARMGFLTVVNSIIHCSNIELLMNRLQLANLLRVSKMSEKDAFEYYKLVAKLCDEDRWSEYAIDPTIIVIPDKEEPFMIVLKDLIAVSTDFSEKIADVCRESMIFLELDYRGAD
jgi:hypothetical protein